MTGRGWQKQYAVKQTDASKLCVLPGVAEALVTKEQALRADAQLRGKRLHPGASHQEIADTFLLAHGFARCGHCNATMAAMNRVQRRTNPRTGRTFVYRYRNYQCSGEGCTHKQIAEPVEAFAWDETCKLLENPAPLWNQLEAHERQYVTPTASRVEALTARLAEIEDEASNLMASLRRMAGKRGSQYIEADLERLGQEEAEVRQKLAIAEAQHADWQHVRNLLTLLLSGTPAAAQTIADKRLAMRALGVTVTLYRKGHAPPWEFEVTPFSAQRPPARVPMKSGVPYSAYLEKSSTIILPLPIDLVEPLTELLRRGGNNSTTVGPRPAPAPTPAAPAAPPATPSAPTTPMLPPQQP